MRAVLKAAAAACALGVLLVGVPLLLARFGSWPFHGVPSLDQIRRAPTQVLTDDAVFSILTVAAWVAWMAFAGSVIVEAASMFGGRAHVQLPFASPFQAGARQLVGALLITTTMVGRGGAAVPARPLTVVSTTLATSSASTAPTTSLPSSTTMVRSTPTLGTAPGSVTGVTAPPAQAVASEGAGTESTAGAIVTVGPGDSPWSIAESRLGDGMRWREIWDLNHTQPQADGSVWVEPQRLDVGWRLRLPSDARGAPAAPSSQVANPIYVVRPGDTLSDIARAQLGDPNLSSVLFQVNEGRSQADGRSLTDPNLILPGWHLILPTASTPSAPSVAPQPAPPESSTFSVATTPAPPSTVEPRSTTTTSSKVKPPTIPSPGHASPTATPPSSPTTAAPAVPQQLQPSPTAPAATAPRATTPVESARPLRLRQSDTADDKSLIPSSVPPVAGVTGALVLSSAVAELLIRKRRRRAARGGTATQSESTPAAPVERAAMSAADLSLVRWAGQQLAQLLERLNPDQCNAIPIAVELSEAHGIEVLWNKPADGPPDGWVTLEGGWSWCVPYDPEAPTSTDELPASLPSLVTVGTRDGRPLLLNLEAFGAVGISGPTDAVAGLLRSIAAELALGEELSNARPFVVGEPLTSVELGDRSVSVMLDEARDRLTAARKACEHALDASSGGAFGYRCGPEPLHLEDVVAVIAAPLDDDEVDRLVELAVPDRGIAVTLVDPNRHCATHIELSDQGAVLRPLGIEFDPAFLPSSASADLVALTRDNAPDPDGSEGAWTARDDVLDSPEPLFDLREGSVPDASDVPVPEDAHEWPELLVRVLGQPRVDGRPDLGERQASLTAFLAMLGRPATNADIVEAIWGGKAIQERTVWNLVSRTRSSLDRFSSGEPVFPPANQSQRTYALHPDTTTDVDLLQRAYRRAATCPDDGDALNGLDRALGLVEGRPFGAAGFEWAFREGQFGATASQLIEDASLHVARRATESGDFDMARRAIRRGLHGLPGNEVLYRARMQLEADAGNTAGVQQAYKELVQQLLDFDEQPSEETVELRAALRRRDADQASV